jgi:hypothetical protein
MAGNGSEFTSPALDDWANPQRPDSASRLSTNGANVTTIENQALKRSRKRGQIQSMNTSTKAFVAAISRCNLLMRSQPTRRHEGSETS